VFILAAAISSSASAGPPFITDDPEPTDTGHFENYFYVQGTRAAGETSGPAEGIEINYGAFPDTQLTLSVPLDFNPGPGGMGMLFAPVGLGVKYRFIEEDDEGWRPQVAVFPQIQIPAGSASRNVPTTELLPLWAQKSFSQWTAFGGGGLTLNPGAGNRDYLIFSGALLRQVGDRLQIGAEMFGQTRGSTASGGSAAVGLGALYDLSDNWHLIGSVNTGIVNGRESDAHSYIFAVKWTI
jgi:hypothetical protein